MKALVIKECGNTHFIPMSSILRAAFKPKRTENIDDTPYFEGKSDFRRAGFEKLQCPAQVDLVLAEQDSSENHGSYNNTMEFYGDDAERMFNLIVTGADGYTGNFDFGENKFHPLDVLDEQES